jgi:hypothetical protein
MLRNMRPLWCVTLSASVWLGTATVVLAQPTPQEWHKGTALSVFGGAASASSGTDGAAGAAIGWEFTPRFTLEGSGLWTAGRDVEGFSALAGTRINLLPPRGVVPFVVAGLGLYQATLDVDRSETPQFYTRRMRVAIRAGSGGPQQTFRDFATSIGGGIDLYLKQHLALRPDVRVLFVHADGDTRPMGVYGVHLVYHFEEHPITP